MLIQMCEGFRNLFLVLFLRDSTIAIAPSLDDMPAHPYGSHPYVRIYSDGRRKLLLGNLAGHLYLNTASMGLHVVHVFWATSTESAL